MYFDGAYVRPTRAPGSSAWEYTSRLLSSARECLSNSDLLAAGGDKSVALQCAIEGVTLASEAVLVSAGVEGMDRETATRQLSKMLRHTGWSVQGPTWETLVTTLGPPVPSSLSDCIFQWGHLRISASTPLEERDLEAKIDAAKRYVSEVERLLRVDLPARAQHTLGGWQVLPPEDRAGGAYGRA